MFTIMLNKTWLSKQVGAYYCHNYHNKQVNTYIYTLHKALYVLEMPAFTYTNTNA
jgi:hypothetical protein